jgi:hypothetical protein
MQTVKSLVMFSALILVAAPACDADDPTGGSEAALAQAGSEADPRESQGDDQDRGDEARVARAQLETQVEQLQDLVGFDPLPGQPISSLDVFVFTTREDVIAITGASDGFLAPFPANIATMDEPSIADGVLITTKIRNLADQIIGFGSEQEVVDLVNAMGDTTYTLTLPDRGTLMLKQVEDFSAPFAEIADMIASEEYIRTYDPPLVFVTTVPLTGQVVGGSGEFSDAEGYMLEIDIVHGINLIDRALDLTIVVPVGIL